jgi:uncharacterized protein YdeI (YjbR/CyaY-like superfamily)
MNEDSLPTSEIERITATNGDEFRAWLHEHHATADAVWLVYSKKGSGTASIAWSEAVDEALCYGWIDSKSQSIDDDRYEQYFCPRYRSGEERFYECVQERCRHRRSRPAATCPIRRGPQHRQR